MNKRTKKLEKGITLIALIITIIVLLILAGVTIASLTGENGLLNKAETSKETTTKAEAEEQVKLAIMASYNTSGKIDLGELKTNLNNIKGITGVPDEITDDSFPLEVTIDGQKIELIKTGETITVVATGGTTPPSTPEEPTVVEVTGVTLNKEEVSLVKGDQETLAVTIEPEDATNKEVTWTSSDEGVATVENGVVTAIAEGTVTITVKTTSGEKTASCVVTVETVTYTAYNVGDTFSVGDETFYVIEASDVNTEIVKGLAAKNIDTSTLKQSDSAQTIAFSKAGGFTEGEDLNNNDTVKADTTSAVYKAKQYAETTIGNGATGRLMTFDELRASNNLDILYGTNTKAGYLNYWLGYADESSWVWCVIGEDSNLLGVSFNNNYCCGVRPVIEISKSSVQ